MLTPDEQAELAAATEARLAARERGEEPPAEAYTPTQRELEYPERLAEKVEREHRRLGEPVRIDPADLPQPNHEWVRAELERRRKLANTLTTIDADGTKRTYLLRPSGKFQPVPPRLFDKPSPCTPRRASTTSRRRPRGRTARRLSPSRNGPPEPDDDPPHELVVIPLPVFRRQLQRAFEARQA